MSECVLKTLAFRGLRVGPSKKNRAIRITDRQEWQSTVQKTPWGGEKKRGVENLTNDSPPKKGFWTPLVRYVFHPPQVSVLCFSCTKSHDRADQKLFWRGPKIFGRVRSLVRFPPPIRFAPPHVTAQTVDGPKWTKMDLFKPKWTKMDHFGPFWSPKS